MGLSTYIEKRNFRNTSEPKGKKETKTPALIFVVQKHDASRLHYDFRLEMEGVLKSWAVPKGPSMNPEDKRLAMMVEDHPYEYKDFEGTIPEGNYGAGNVIVWDKGTYHSLAAGSKKEEENILLQDLKKGHITFVLEGEKLKGEFALVKMKGKQENAWLLIKKHDEFASSKDILKKNKSVLSHQPLKKKHQKKIVKNKSKPADPMLAQIREEPFDDGNWIFERKFDGYRALASIENAQVELYSRNHLSFNTTFKSIAEELKKIPHSCLLDGEVVVENEKGISSFQLLQNFQKTGKGALKYYVFDILNLNGIDLTNIPLIQRKELLEMLLAQQKLHNIYFSEFITGKGKSFYQSAMQHQLEGIIAKKASSPYRLGKRSCEWLKIKIQQQQEAIIIGLTLPKGGRKYFGALLLGVYDEEKLEYIGKCGTGFNQQALKEIYNELKSYFISESPLNEKINESGSIQWLQPKVVCEIKFSEWTTDGNMRHPVFLGLRKDKSAMEVSREITEEKKKKIVKNENKKSTFTNLDKIYWPQEKITKGDLIAYYTKMAPTMLPYLKNRPESLHRFPNGIKGENFFQKNINRKQSPEWIKTEKIYSASNKEYIDYLICNDKTSLLYMANLGCIEINPWNSRVGNIENPDWLVIDLDPEKIAFKEVVKAALETKKIFDQLKMDSYCKTSGATGLHVYVPLAGKYNYDTVKNFAELIAQYVHSKLPATTSIVRNPSKRQKKVYLDFLQNRKGQTLAAPYSVRPRIGATVSIPLKWKEVNDKLDPASFTIKNIFSRLVKVGDLWKPVLGKGADLGKALEMFENLK